MNGIGATGVAAAAAVGAMAQVATTTTTSLVVALVKGVAELPCDVTTATELAGTDADVDPVRLVLWYRIDSSTPIYRYI